jgi:hypothetical protein
MAEFCHSGLSGIFLANSLSNPSLEKDSGQAGMTTRGLMNVFIIMPLFGKEGCGEIFFIESPFLNIKINKR